MTSADQASARAAVPRHAMAAAAAIGAANVYYSQPMLGAIVREMPGIAAQSVVTATQLGFAAGLFLLVPLGDRVDRRALIVAQFAGLVIALVAAASAPDALALALVSFALGMMATAAQQIVPFAAQLAAPERRGAIVGSVMSGLLGGILLSRVLAGVVASYWGWRAMFWLGVPLALAGGVLMRARLPVCPPQTRQSYGSLLRSLAHLWREFPALRRAAFTQALLFAGFSAFWTILSLYLEGPPFRQSSSVAGMFGLVGLIGILAAPVAGRIADRHGPRRTILASAGLVIASFAVFGLWTSIAGLVAGVILLDLGVQSALISHQFLIYALREDARGRLNTLFMGTMFCGGAIGSASASAAWHAAGWWAVCLLGTGFAAAALLMAIGRDAAADRGARS